MSGALLIPLPWGEQKSTAFDNSLVTIPNNTVWSSVIDNQTGHDIKGVSISFQVGYDSPLDKVEEVLLEIYKNHPLVLDDPEPFMFPWEFRTSAINVLTAGFTKTENRWEVYADMFKLIQKHMAEAGIDLVDYNEVNLYYPDGRPAPISPQTIKALESKPPVLVPEAKPPAPQTV